MYHFLDDIFAPRDGGAESSHISTRVYFAQCVESSVVCRCLSIF
jgi:hypothetical protein